jgi:hypothetical protein
LGSICGWPNFIGGSWVPWAFREILDSTRDGEKESESWDDQAWLISKEDAHIAKGKLVANTSGARKILDVIGPVKYVKGDIFQGHPRKNVPEREKPTPAQRHAQMKNIRKAQQA